MVVAYEQQHHDGLEACSHGEISCLGVSSLLVPALFASTPSFAATRRPKEVIRDQDAPRQVILHRRPCRVLQGTTLVGTQYRRACLCGVAVPSSSTTIER